MSVRSMHIITTLIPGRKAPMLISEETVKAMKPGSVILDMAVDQGGNCTLSEQGKTVSNMACTSSAKAIWPRAWQRIARIE